MGFIIWIVFGGLAGWIASLIMKTNESQGTVTDILVGIVGAAIGGYLSTMLGIGAVTGFNVPSLIIAVIGSVILIALLRAIKR